MPGPSRRYETIRMGLGALSAEARLSWYPAGRAPAAAKAAAAMATAVAAEELLVEEEMETVEAVYQRPVAAR